MIRLLVVLSLIGAAFSCKEQPDQGADPGWGDEGNRGDITFMSYNVKYCSPMGSNVPNVDDVAAVINRAQPDVVFLQEVDRNTTRSGNMDQLAVLSEKTDMPYTFYGRAIDYQGGQTGLGILSNYPLEDPQIHSLPRIELEGQYVSYRIMMEAQIEVEDQTLTIANTHLELTQANRDLQVPEIIEILTSKPYPVVFGGDFNARPDNATMLTFFDSGFPKACQNDCFTIPSDVPNREIDFILYHPEEKLEVYATQVVGTQASDHLPILAVFRLK